MRYLLYFTKFTFAEREFIENCFLTSSTIICSTFVLKVSPPVRPSGQIKDSERLVLVGPCGTVYLNEGVIIANRHIHLDPDYAEANGIKDNDYVDVLVEGIKPTRFDDVQVRVSDDFRCEMHIDTDDANSTLLKNGDKVKILKRK